MALTEGSLEKECLREKLEKEKRHIEDLKADNQQIADTLRDKRQNNEKMRQFLEEKDEELAQQEEESKSLREKLNHAENDLNKAKELTRDLQNKSQSLENELHSKESLIEVLRKELEAERQRHVKESLELREELETERHMYSQELSELRNQRLEMEERLRTKKDQFPIQVLEAENSLFPSESAEELKQRLSILLSSNESIRESCRRSTMGYGTKIAKLKTQNCQLKAQISIQKQLQSCVDHDAVIAQLQNDLLTAQSHISELQHNLLEFGALKKRNEMLERQLEKSQQHIKGLNKKSFRTTMTAETRKEFSRLKDVEILNSVKIKEMEWELKEAEKENDELKEQVKSGNKKEEERPSEDEVDSFRPAKSFFDSYFPSDSLSPDDEEEPQLQSTRIPGVSHRSSPASGVLRSSNRNCEERDLQENIARLSDFYKQLNLVSIDSKLKQWSPRSVSTGVCSLAESPESQSTPRYSKAKSAKKNGLFEKTHRLTMSIKKKSRTKKVFDAPKQD
ncbi:hypothetical protein L596_028437 [Steinernema carpocapsae]|uniref:Uncharacterized protein n=2 Tax=Steinernema carpocapsae TaxID=34508 RepID=A0A4V5ZXW0_STECR|nr:hypothetical protein L596_028437 [Steinernema carpocapsae]